MEPRVIATIIILAALIPAAGATDGYINSGDSIQDAIDGASEATRYHLTYT
ncbi:MAG: hypothetical protein KAT13_05100 [Methanosarcinales archaeon]|nr:hypothetical protein [Methanosarcinales archaeon]